MTEVSGIESMMWGAGLVAFLIIAYKKAGKIADERNPELNRPYILSDKGWTDDHHQLNHDVRDFDILHKDESGEWELIYKGRITGDDPRTPRYTEEDIDYVDQYRSIHFKDGFVLDQSVIRDDFHRYYDIRNYYPAFSREQVAEKMAITNGFPSLAEIEYYDLVDIRHENKQMQYIKFEKGTCPRKYRKHLITGVSSQGVITKAVINHYKNWDMEPPKPLTEDPVLKPILSPFTQEQP